MKRAKVSIIIPVYNVESYIERCVRSLFEQTLDSLEYIFIDDCGTDSSIDTLQRVIQAFPHRISQIKLIRHTINQGVSQSRQDGVDAASGEYIIHCDPDDWVEIDMYEKLYIKAKETDADIVICDYYNVINNNYTKSNCNKSKISNRELLKGIAGLENNIQGSLWNKLIRRELTKSVGFNCSIEYCEDVLYLFRLLSNNVSIEYLHEPLYYYVNSRPQSLVHNISPQAVDKDLILIDELLRLERDNDNEYKRCVRSFIETLVVNRALKYSNLNQALFTSTYKPLLSLRGRNQSINKLKYFVAYLATRGYRIFALRLLKVFNYLKN